MTGSFEGKKHAWRQTQDGIVVSFVIHPNDVDAAFAVAPLGTRYMVGFAEIGDDGRPVAKAPVAKPAETKERRPFASLPLSQQAAIRTNDPIFRRFLAGKDGPSDFLVLDTDMAADEIRHVCGVTSRGHIKENSPSGDKWLQLENRYQSWLTDQRYASVAR